MNANHELRISAIEEWIVQFTNIVSDTLPPAYAEDLQNMTMQLMAPALQAKKTKEAGETIVLD